MKMYVPLRYIYCAATDKDRGLVRVCVCVCVRVQLQFTRVLTLMELQRLRRQFISFTKTRAADDPLKIADLFIQFLNSRTQ